MQLYNTAIIVESSEDPDDPARCSRHARAWVGWYLFTCATVDEQRVNHVTIQWHMAVDSLS